MVDAKKEALENAVSTHEKYMQSQGIPIYRGFDFPSLNELEVGPWKRLGAFGAYVDFEGAEANDTYILEIPPQGRVNPEKHLYEEIVYVLSGRGATTVWQADSPKRAFEWHEGSLFALPLNAWHQFFNGQGDQPARFYVVSSAPVVMNLFHHPPPQRRKASFSPERRDSATPRSGYNLRTTPSFSM